MRALPSRAIFLLPLLLALASACASDPACESSTTIYLSDLATASQYGYYHDYSGATAGFTYDTPADDKISGTFAAAGLKPYATYQLKFDGKPVCAGGTDDAGNEYLGYLGRWWNNTDGGNVNDAYYEANSVYKGGTKCISGYLVWGYVTADADGNVAAKAVTADTSYHVLWCDENSACGGANSNADLITPDAAHPTINFCAADGVYGELERFTCGGLTFAPGNYGLKMILNEESFHQGPGTWTAVMAGNILFGIN